MRGGYAGRILRVDLSSGRIAVTPTSDYAERFLGGRGIAAKAYWDEVTPGARALDEENTVIFATGPVGGVPVFAGSRWTVCGKVPGVERFSYGNLGGGVGVRDRDEELLCNATQGIKMSICHFNILYANHLSYAIIHQAIVVFSRPSRVPWWRRCHRQQH